MSNTAGDRLGVTVTRSMVDGVDVIGSAVELDDDDVPGMVERVVDDDAAVSGAAATDDSDDVDDDDGAATDGRVTMDDAAAEPPAVGRATMTTATDAARAPSAIPGAHHCANR